MFVLCNVQVLPAKRFVFETQQRLLTAKQPMTRNKPWRHLFQNIRALLPGMKKQQVVKDNAAKRTVGCQLYVGRLNLRLLIYPVQIFWAWIAPYKRMVMTNCRLLTYSDLQELNRYNGRLGYITRQVQGRGFEKVDGTIL